jgi:acetylornithine/succinyldiaminopimelate/putrescine aminotransferase
VSARRPWATSALVESPGGYEMVKEVRGAGLLNGIEFQPPRSLKLRVPQRFAPSDCLGRCW